MILATVSWLEKKLTEEGDCNWRERPVNFREKTCVKIEEGNDESNKVNGKS